jgi:Fe-S cluster assembly protein SufD
MIAEKSQVTNDIIDRISGTANKVGFISNEVLSKAFAYLEHSGIPNNKNEDYKYFNADALFKKEFKKIEQRFESVSDVEKFKLADCINLVVVNGTYSEQLSDKLILRGLHLLSFDHLDAGAEKLFSSIADVEQDAFVAFNTAFCPAGFYFKVEKDTVMNMPIHLLYVSCASSEVFVNNRNLIEIESGAEATIIEQQINIGNGKVFNNFLSEKLVAKNAKLTSYTLQIEGDAGYSVNTQQILLESDALYDNATFTLSGQVVRNNHQVILSGENSQAHLNGLFVTKGNQLVDNHTLMDHRVPRCESNELYKGIINDKSTGVFNGKIFVRKDAQKTNAYQSSKNILLSDDATINTKPQLEIYADDVKCSHGTSTGKIDENALFYLNARGIGKASAKNLLLSAFAHEVIDKIQVDSLKEKVADLFENKI